MKEESSNSSSNSSKMSVQEAGRKGGIARAEKYTREELSAQARRASQTIERKHPGFHAEIGGKGGRASRGGGEKKEEEER